MTFFTHLVTMVIIMDNDNHFEILPSSFVKEYTADEI